MFRYALALLALTASLVAQEKPQQQQPAPQRIAIRAGALIDGKSNDVRRNVVINVVGNKIESVTDGASFRPATGTQVIDLSKSTVLPGLVDAHTHLFLMGEEPSQGGYDVNILKYSVSYRSARATANAKRALEQGFTTIRDLETEGAGYGDVGIKQAVNEGYVPRRQADTRSKATRRSTSGRRAYRSSTGQSKRARPRASSSTTAPIGSRFT
jgi:imidazolonepropionase-like amidohydrolase